jgi:hypothetical protein
MLSKAIMAEMKRLRGLVVEINKVDDVLSWDLDFSDKEIMPKISQACCLLLEACDAAERRNAQVDDVDEAWDEALSHEEYLEELRIERENYEVMAERNAERQHPIG